MISLPFCRRRREIVSPSDGVRQQATSATYKRATNSFVMYASTKGALDLSAFFRAALGLSMGRWSQGRKTKNGKMPNWTQVLPSPGHSRKLNCGRVTIRLIRRPKWPSTRHYCNLHPTGPGRDAKIQIWESKCSHPSVYLPTRHTVLDVASGGIRHTKDKY